MIHAAWKSLLGRKLRLLSSTFAIVLGVSFVSGTLIFTDTLNKSFTTLFDSSVGDVVVRPQGVGDNDQPSTLTVPGSLVTTLAKVPGASRADGNVVVFGVFVISTTNKVVGGVGAPGISFNDSDAPAAHGVPSLQVTEGSRPRGPDEVAMDAATAERAGYVIGDTVRLASVGARPLLTPKLVGLASFPDGGSLNGATATIWDTKTIQSLFFKGSDVYSNIWLSAAPGVSQAQLRKEVAALLPSGLEAVTGDKAADEGAGELLKAIGFITIFLLVFAAISLVVGSFLIVNTFSMLVAQRSRELALLRALGASRRQVTRSVLFEAFVLGLLGSTLGLFLGVGLAVLIRLLMNTFGGLDLSGTGLVYQSSTVIWCYVVGLFVTMAAAYLPARRSARIPPIAALRDDVAMPESSLRKRWIAGLLLTSLGAALGLTGLFGGVSSPAYWVGFGALFSLLGIAGASPVIAHPFLKVTAAVYSRVFGSVGRLAGQNALRNPRRTAATASALMIGLALVTTMSIAGSSANASVDETVRKNFIGDLVIGNVIGQGFSPQVATDVEAVPGVKSVTRVRYARAKVGEQSAYLIGTDTGAVGDVVNVQVVAGSLSALTDGTVMVSDRTAKKHGYRIGQKIALTTPKGVRNLPIVAIYQTNPVLGAGYATTIGTMEANGFAIADNLVYVKLVPAVGAEDVKTAIEAKTAALPTISVKNQVEFAAEQRGPIDALLKIIYALLFLALLIAVLGVINTLGLSVIERTREIGLLRAIGLSRRQLRRMVGLESVVISVLGALLGIGMGIVFGICLMVSLRDEGLEVTVVPWGNLAGYLVVAAVIGVFAAIFPARRAARLDVLRAISTE